MSPLYFFPQAVYKVMLYMPEVMWPGEMPEDPAQLPTRWRRCSGEIELSTQLPRKKPTVKEFTGTHAATLTT